MNRKIKGGVINIYPLEDLPDLRKPLKQVPPNVKSMLEIVKLRNDADPRLQILLDSVFGNTVLTKNYDDALKAAQELKFNCITTDFQVVYGGSFVVKVGHYNRQAQDRFTVYKKLSIIKNQIQQKTAKVAEIESQRDKNSQ